MIQRFQRVVLQSGLVVLAAVLLIAAGKFVDMLDRPAVTASLADGRSGKLRFTSYSAQWWELSDSAFRRHPVDVSAELLLPLGAAHPVPAAILLHGSDGLSALQYRYARSLLRWGMAVFVIDSFTARGVGDTVQDPAMVTPYSMLIDAYQALHLLQTHPSVDGQRIALVGWSKGGMVADWASRMRYQRLLSHEGRAFAAHAAFYPWCGEQHMPVQLTGAPLLYLVGARDDWTGVQPCVDYVGRVRDAGYRVELSLYPHAEHGFDYPGRFRRYLAGAQSWAHCSYTWGETGFRVVASGEVLPWSEFDRYVRRCVQAGAHVGSNVIARDRSSRDLRAFLSASLARRSGR